MWLQVILGGSGSELQFCLEAKKLLAGECDVRVVSMMCWEVFEKQSEEYKEQVLLLSQKNKGKLVSGYVEASSTLGTDSPPTKTRSPQAFFCSASAVSCECTLRQAARSTLAFP